METDLSNILEPASITTTETSSPNAAIDYNNSTDEDEIIKQIEQKTKLDKDKIKRAIKFKKKEPVKDDKEDEIEETQPTASSIVQLGYITKVNGSVIVRLG